MRRLAVAVLLAAALPTSASAADFTARIDNPYFPAHPGMRWVYRGIEDHSPARDVVRVAARVKIVDGVPCAVLHDRVYHRSILVERTTDWYTQDGDGNVWYYGEATAEFDRHGHVISREGSWRDGRDGAKAGIFMPAHPRAGQRFRQEDYPGHAEDRFAVMTRHGTIDTPYRAFRGTALKTKEWTPLEPRVRDRKWYARGIGQVGEATIRGGDDRLELTSFSAG